MNGLSWGLVSLRALATLFSLQGRTRDSDGLNSLANAAEAGMNVDAHMQKVADQLKAGTPIDWDDITSRIEAASDRLQDKPF